MGTRGRILLLCVLLPGVVLARLCAPAAAEKTRAQAARLLADDLNNLQLVETLGRTAAQGEWRRELVEVISGRLRMRGA